MDGVRDVFRTRVKIALCSYPTDSSEQGVCSYRLSWAVPKVAPTPIAPKACAHSVAQKFILGYYWDRCPCPMFL